MPCLLNATVCNNFLELVHSVAFSRVRVNQSLILLTSSVLIMDFLSFCFSLGSKFMRTECLNSRYAFDVPLPVSRLVAMIGNSILSVTVFVQNYLGIVS